MIMDDADRLSALPDDLILKILSFLPLKDAIGTSFLSSRWRFLWTCSPCLTFSTEDFSLWNSMADDPTRMSKLVKFVSDVLSRRNSQVQLSSVSLYVRLKRPNDVTKRIIRSTFSLDVQQLDITCSFGFADNRQRLRFTKGDGKFRLSLSGSRTLKHLTLTRPSDDTCDQIVLKSAHEFSSLTTLHLHQINIRDGFLCMCPNLKTLTLYHCNVHRSTVFSICHPRLSNLTVKKVYDQTVPVNVVTPQLKNLIILEHDGKFRVYAPELTSLIIRGLCPDVFSTDGFPCLEKALLSLPSVPILRSSCAPTIISMLQHFRNVKHLSLSMEIIQLLNLSVELILDQPSPLANLESLTLLPRVCVWLGDKHTRVVVSLTNEVKNYLLNSSPKATITEVLREKCSDVRCRCWR